jgi:TatA/E family protein of Tat protein translocase
MIVLPAFIEGIGGSEVLLIMFLVLILFGSDKLPGLARGMGKTIREFKKAASGVEEEFRKAMEEEPAKPPARTSPPAAIPNQPTETKPPPAPPFE